MKMESRRQQIFPEGSLSQLRNIKASPTNGGDDGTAEEGGRGQVPVAGKVLRKAVHIQACLHRRHHSLQRVGIKKTVRRLHSFNFTKNKRNEEENSIHLNRMNSGLIPSQYFQRYLHKPVEVQLSHTAVIMKEGVFGSQQVCVCQALFRGLQGAKNKRSHHQVKYDPRQQGQQGGATHFPPCFSRMWRQRLESRLAVRIQLTINRKSF